MEASIKLGRIWGIPIGLHSSWFLVFGLVTWSLAVGFFPDEYPQLTATTHWVLGAVTSLLFFGSVLAHELGHALLALRNNIPVRAITLFIFGGVAQMEREPHTPGEEFRIAIAGPIVSLLLAGLFGVLYFLDQSIPWLAAPSQWLARINLSLALFNLIPGFPLDGGRVLRAIIWRIRGNFTQATRVSSFVGQVVAFGFIGIGILVVLTGNLFNGLWLVFIGWFLQNAAAASYAQVNVANALNGLQVAQVMNKNWPTIPSKTPLSLLVEEKILRGGPRYYFVARDGYGQEGDERPAGMISVTNVMAVPQSQWAFTPVDRIMIPWERLVVAQPEMHLLDAVQVMDAANVAQLPVLRADRLVGVLSREQIVHHLRLRAELRL